jgi:hypothetical protein
VALGIDRADALADHPAAKHLARILLPHRRADVRLLARAIVQSIRGSTAPEGCENVASARSSVSACHSTLPPAGDEVAEHGLSLLGGLALDDVIVAEHDRRVLAFGLRQEAQRQHGVGIIGAE